MKSYFSAFLWISLDMIIHGHRCPRIIVEALSISHFKGLDMRNLQYEIRICQKHHNKVTMTIVVGYFLYLSNYMSFSLFQGPNQDHPHHLSQSPTKTYPLQTNWPLGVQIWKRGQKGVHPHPPRPKKLHLYWIRSEQEKTWKRLKKGN